MNKSIKAWHFLSDNKRLGYNDSRLVQSGKTYRYKGKEPIKLCENGMHGSKRLIDALQYANGSVICRVELSGDIIHGDDKIVATERKVLWMADATNTLHEFACRVAEDVLRKADISDERCWNAIKMKRLYIQGKASGDDLSAAWYAAYWYAAGDAAGDAAYWDAARSAAWSAAYWDAARSAAWSAAGYAQNRKLTAMISALSRKGK